MDRLTEYRAIIKKLLTEYAQIKPAHGEIETEVAILLSIFRWEVSGWIGKYCSQLLA